MNHSTFSSTGARIKGNQGIWTFSRKHKNTESSAATCKEKAIHIHGRTKGLSLKHQRYAVHSRHEIFFLVIFFTYCNQCTQKSMALIDNVKGKEFAIW